MPILRIGAAVLTDSPAILSARYGVPPFSLPEDAPALPPLFDSAFYLDNVVQFGGPGDFDQWLATMGLQDLFSNGYNGLTRRRDSLPARLLPWHEARLAQAHADYVAAYPDDLPGYGVGQSTALARLESLQWWVSYFIDLAPATAAVAYEP